MFLTQTYFFQMSSIWISPSTLTAPALLHACIITILYVQTLYCMCTVYPFLCYVQKINKCTNTKGNNKLYFIFKQRVFWQTLKMLSVRSTSKEKEHWVFLPSTLPGNGIHAPAGYFQFMPSRNNFLSDCQMLSHVASKGWTIAVIQLRVKSWKRSSATWGLNSA